MAGVAEFLAGFFEGIGEDGEDDFAGVAADEVEAALLVDELELRGHRAALVWAQSTDPDRGILRFAQNDSVCPVSDGPDTARNGCATGSIHRIAGRIN